MEEIKKVQLLDKLNVSRNICNHLIGKEHKISHRMWIGFIVMAFGVTFSYGAVVIENVLAHIFFDLFGYLIHGVGMIPFISYLENFISNE